ncbi:hypothetical protein AV540_18045 [Brevibacillus parabrevis]|nr:hypothetical protein AV540_18045 [Brevibacillus parabrevis]
MQKKTDTAQSCRFFHYGNITAKADKDKKGTRSLCRNWSDWFLDGYDFADLAQPVPGSIRTSESKPNLPSRHIVKRSS